MIWRKSQSLSECFSASRADGSLVTGSGNASPQPSKLACAIGQRRYPAPLSRLSADSRQPRPVVRKRGNKGGRSWLQRILISACLVMMLPACSMLAPKPPEPAPIAVKPEPLTCLDRLLESCEGVQSVRPESCADAVVIAVDSLTALLACQDRHAELVRCVREYQDRNR